MWHKSFRFGNFYRSEISRNLIFSCCGYIMVTTTQWGQNNIIKMRNCEEANHELKLTKNSLKVYRGHHSIINTHEESIQLTITCSKSMETLEKFVKSVQS